MWFAYLFLLNLDMQNIKDLITIDPETLGGQPVFKGTRVPVDSLFDHLESGISIDEFLDDFPTVSKEQAIAIMELARKLISSKNLSDLYASAA
jgi:uncharacterized protein (DUF433 family)